MVQVVFQTKLFMFKRHGWGWNEYWHVTEYLSDGTKREFDVPGRIVLYKSLSLIDYLS